MKNYILFIGLFFFVLLSACKQKHHENLLVGTWELDKKSDDLKTDLSIKPIKKDKVSPEETSKPEIILKFNENFTVDFKQGANSYKAKYSKKKDMLLLGTTEYKILKLDEDSLILIENNQIIPTTYHYVKTNRKFKTIKEYETIEERYTNGQLKIKGTYHNGYEDGIWEEWFENGQKKSEKIYKDGMPTGIWKEWDEKGKLISNRVIK